MSSDTDDIDAGWDEAPSAAGQEAAPQQPRRVRQVAASDDRRGFSEPPVATPVSAFHALNEPRARSSHSLTPAEVGARSSLRPARAGGRPLLPVAAVFVVAVGTRLWLSHESNAGRHSSPVAGQVSEPPPAAPAAPVTEIPHDPLPAATQVPPAEPAAARPAKPDTPAEAGSIEPLVLYAPDTSNVTVTSTPSGAVFFESGTRLGSGQVTLRITSPSKRYLTALLSGYAPLNFRVDGSKPLVTVKLTPVEASKASGPEHDAPRDAPPSGSPAPE